MINYQILFLVYIIHLISFLSLTFFSVGKTSTVFTVAMSSKRTRSTFFLDKQRGTKILAKENAKTVAMQKTAYVSIADTKRIVVLVQTSLYFIRQCATL